MSIEEMQAAMVGIATEMNQRLGALEESDRERQARYEKLDAEDRARRKEEYRKHDERAVEALELHRRSVATAEELTAAVREWMATR